MAAAADLRAVDSRLESVESDVKDVENKISDIDKRTRDASAMLITLIVLYVMLLFVATVTGILTYNKVSSVQSSVVTRGMDTLQNFFAAGKSYLSTDEGQQRLGGIRRQATSAFRRQTNK